MIFFLLFSIVILAEALSSHLTSSIDSTADAGTWYERLEGNKCVDGGDHAYAATVEACQDLAVARKKSWVQYSATDPLCRVVEESDCDAPISSSNFKVYEYFTDIYAWRDESEFEDCNAECGSGFKIRIRTCKNWEGEEVFDESLCGVELSPQDKVICDTEVLCDNGWHKQTEEMLSCPNANVNGNTCIQDRTLSECLYTCDKEITMCNGEHYTEATKTSCFKFCAAEKFVYGVPSNPMTQVWTLETISEEDRYLRAFQKWVDDYALITTKSGEGCSLYTHYSEDAYLEVQVFGDFAASMEGNVGIAEWLCEAFIVVADVEVALVDVEYQGNGVMVGTFSPFADATGNLPGFPSAMLEDNNRAFIITGYLDVDNHFIAQRDYTCLGFCVVDDSEPSTTDNDPCADIMCPAIVCEDGSNPPKPAGECCGDLQLCPDYSVPSVLPTEYDMNQKFLPVILCCTSNAWYIGDRSGDVSAKDFMQDYGCVSPKIGLEYVRYYFFLFIEF